MNGAPPSTSDNLYLGRPFFEKVGIICPSFVSTIIVLSLWIHDKLPNQTTTLMWLLIVVFIDVAHVWSTLFRTYLNKEGHKNHQKALWLIPLLCYLVGVALYGHGKLTFWRTLAYFAVFHFVRQQYGLYALYYFKEKKKTPPLFNKVAIYSTTIIPLTIWHLSGPQSFHWFIPFDFFYLNLPQNSLVPLIYFFKLLGPLILVLYLLREIKQEGPTLLFKPRFGILVGTYLAWWTGIVWLANDWSFTLTNVVTHGIPYFTLIGLSHFNNENSGQLLWPKRLGFLGAMVFLILVGTLEEGLWDVFLWRDHPLVFGHLYGLKSVKNLSIQAFLVPLLALPQATHYALDGLIWRRERVCSKFYHHENNSHSRCLGSLSSLK